MLDNDCLYNDKELFKQGGLDWYNYGFRNYDPQIARFSQLDPLTDGFPELTPYQYASDEPIANVDLDGLEELNVINDASKLTTDAAFGVMDYISVVITAVKPLSTSASLVKGFSVFSEIEGISSIFLHSVQTLGLIIGNDGTTKAVGF